MHKLILILSIISLPLISVSQTCNDFFKQCLPKISPYTHNGQLNSTIITSGQTIELKMTFYSGQDYRIMICSQEALGKIQFRLLDADHNEVFNNKDSDLAAFFDFNVSSTQQLTIEITAPPSSADAVKSGCVSAIGGFRW